MKFFQKIDLPIQIILLLACWLPILIYQSWMLAFFWLWTMPILGLWQLISLGLYISKKLLNKWHKLYLKALGVAAILMLLALLAVSSEIYHEADLLLMAGFVLAFGLAVFYLFVTYKTSKTPIEDRF